MDEGPGKDGLNDGSGGCPLENEMSDQEGTEGLQWQPLSLVKSPSDSSLPEHRILPHS